MKTASKKRSSHQTYGISGRNRNTSSTTRNAAGTKSGSSKSSKKTQDNLYGIEESKLKRLFENELKDIYWAEKALTKALPKMIKNATSEELSSALENHLTETEGQIQKVEQVFELLEKKPTAKKCEAMEGLIDEAEELMKDSDKGAMRDAAIISAAQKVEHYEIASYGTLRTFAQTLGLTEAASLLEEILEEEKAADEKLTEIAQASINVEVLNEQEGDEEEDVEEEEEEDEDVEEEDEY